MMKRMAVRISIPHTEYIYMILGCWSMWVRWSRLDCSAIVWSIGFITWDMKRRFWLRSSFSTTRVSYCRTFRSSSSLLHRSTGRLQRSCGSPLVRSCFRRMRCRRWRRPTVCSTGGTLHGCHGIVASTQYARDSGAPAVVVM